MNLKSIFDQWTPRLLSILRIMGGLLFMEHGTVKLFNFPPMGGAVEIFSLMGVAGIIELAGGAFITLGLFTRMAAFIMSGEMAFAYFMVHAPQGFFPIMNQGELAVLYCFLFLYLATAGGGPWSLDRFMRNRD